MGKFSRKYLKKNASREFFIIFTWCLCNFDTFYQKLGLLAK